MATRLEVPINPATLRWALRRSRLGADSLARAAGVAPERALAWLEGRARPTYKQAQRIANRLHVSLGQLLIPPPERVSAPIHDFRRGPGSREEPSPALLETLYDALRKRDWWREVKGHRRLPFVGSMRWQERTPEEVAAAIRKVIPVERARQQSRDWSDFLGRLAAAAEAAGILVLRRGIMGYNTHQPLDPEEFAGFAIADPVAPMLFINTRDYVARRNFTFAHELAHIWIGQSAIDDNLEVDTRNRMERFCDEVAVALLVPGDEFRRRWRECTGSPHDVAQQCAEFFRVSVWVAARRALELGLATPAWYDEVLRRYAERISRETRGDGGGDFYRNVEVYNSPTFTRTVIDAAHEGELEYGEAASLLGLRLSTFLDLYPRTHARYL